jgi:hypothetical protein
MTPLRRRARSSGHTMTAPEDKMDRLVYFDTSATTPLDPRVAEVSK